MVFDVQKFTFKLLDKKYLGSVSQIYKEHNKMYFPIIFNNKLDALKIALKERNIFARKFTSKKVEEDLPLLDILKYVRKNLQFLVENITDIQQKHPSVDSQKIRCIEKLHTKIC